MPSVSWHSPASVSAFNRALEAALPETARAALERHPELVGIWLFGSRARGTPAARSDVDLLLVAREGRPRPMDRPLDYLDLVDAIPAPVDLLVLLPEEIEQVRDTPFHRRVLAEARPLAVGHGAPPAGLRARPAGESAG